MKMKKNLFLLFYVLAGIVLVSGYSWLVRYLPGRKS